MSKKFTKTESGFGSKTPAKFEGAVPEPRPAKAAKPAWTPRPRTAARTDRPVPFIENAGPVPASRTAAPAPSTPPAAAPASAPTHEGIARLAHDLWAERGRPQGKDIAIWCEAERRLTQK